MTSRSLLLVLLVLLGVVAAGEAGFAVRYRAELSSRNTSNLELPPSGEPVSLVRVVQDGRSRSEHLFSENGDTLTVEVTRLGIDWPRWHWLPLWKSGRTNVTAEVSVTVPGRPSIRGRIVWDIDQTILGLCSARAYRERVLDHTDGEIETLVFSLASQTTKPVDP
jgi:hypothetical protein